MGKRILIVSQYFYPEQFRINDIAATWAREGHQVTVLTGIPNYPQGKFYKGYGWFRKRKETWNGVEIIRIPLFARGKTSVGMVLNYFSFLFSGFFWKCFTRLKADLVFTFGVSPMTQALIGVWFAKRRKIPHYLYVQDLWPETVEIVTGIHSKAVLGPIRKMVDHVYQRCEKIFATSPSFVDEIGKRIPGREGKVLYWPQYAEDFYRPTENHSSLIPQDGVFNITFTGNIGTAQGLEILPKAAQLLESRGLTVRFNIVGDGRYKAQFIEKIRESGMQSYFNLIGWQRATDIPEILSASDAAFLSFADNSLYTMTIPAKLQSYMACGCVILGAVGGESKRVIREAECGLVSALGQADALAESIAYLMDMPLEERQRMKEAGIAYCRTHFDKTMLMREMGQEHLRL